MHYTTNKKIVPSALIAALATAALAVALILPTFAFAQESEQRQSRALDIAESFFESRNNDDAPSFLEWLPEGFLDRFFDRFDGDKPGVGNDTEDPQISEIDTKVTEDMVTIAWETDEKTRGTLYLSMESPVDEDDENTLEIKTPRRWNTEHEIDVEDLESDTTYYALIEAKDKAGNTTISDEFDFTTQDDDDEEDMPVISNVQATATQSAIEVTWSTDQDANSTLFLSTTDPVDPEDDETIEIEDDEQTQDHTLTATGLEAETTYYGIVQSTNENGTATSSPFEIMTSMEDDADEPIIEAVTFESGTTSIDVSWTTNEPATSVVYSSTSSGFALEDDGVHTVSDMELVTAHDLTLTGLEEGTTYYHRVVSEDESGNETVSAEYASSTNE